MNFYRILQYSICIILASISLSAHSQPGPSVTLRRILTQADSTRAPIIFSGGFIHYNDLLVNFYRTKDYSTVWNNGAMSVFITVIRNVGRDGLNPATYHLQSLEMLYSKTRDEQEMAFFDLLLTDAFFKYSSHMLYGRVDMCSLYEDKWEPARPSVDLMQLLHEALFERSMGVVLKELAPGLKDYTRLKEVLHFFNEINTRGGWPSIADGPQIEPGMIDSRIPVIRKRLSLSGQLSSSKNADYEIYDSLLVEDIKIFQAQNGLPDNGIITFETHEALNYSVEYYIKKIIINLERFRWLPKHLGDKYIFVNIPAFQVDIFEEDSIILSMRAIVGRPDRKTPVFSSAISYFIYNPTWTVPPTILEEDMLPAIRRNVNYLKSNRIRVLDRKGIEISPDSLPWARYTINNFPFILRQDPGRFNALGLIKFEFPNSHKVYLHDTNNRGLFNQNFRALSSGCVRIERPLDLATYLLKETSWTKEKIYKTITTGVTGTISFTPSIPIHFVYFTAFVDNNNKLQLRKDIYNWDSILLENIKRIQ